ncbi:MAG: endonuclease III, partial [Polyangiaceae bacterium]
KPAAKRTGVKKLAVKKVVAKVATAVPAKAKSAKKKTPEEIVAVYTRLAKHHHDAHCELDHRNAFELVVATVLSAQSTDVAVNKITPGLFAKYPTPEKMAAASYDDIENAINRIGMFRMKTRSLMGLSRQLIEKHGGKVPETLAELVLLPGVGRKTANVVLGVAFEKSEGVVVDTHVQRLSQRLGWTKHTEPVDIEQDLMKVLPKSEWDRVSHVLIFHGRRICFARKPNCEGCPVNDVCPSAFDAEHVGRKDPRPPRGRGK